MHDGSVAGPARSTRTMDALRRLLAHASELDMRVRMNFTVMRSTVAALPEIMRLAQRLQVQLYLNLATDHTFLFRDGQVSIEARVDQGRVDVALAEVEEVMRADRRFLPRYSELAYLRGHFADLLQTRLPCAESQLKLMVHSTGRGRRLLGTRRDGERADDAARRRSSPARRTGRSTRGSSARSAWAAAATTR